MFCKILAASALTLSLASAAFAQSGTMHSYRTMHASRSDTSLPGVTDSTAGTAAPIGGTTSGDPGENHSYRCMTVTGGALPRTRPILPGELMVD